MYLYKVQQMRGWTSKTLPQCQLREYQVHLTSQARFQCTWHPLCLHWVKTTLVAHGSKVHLSHTSLALENLTAKCTSCNFNSSPYYRPASWTLGLQLTSAADPAVRLILELNLPAPSWICHIPAEFVLLQLNLFLCPPLINRGTYMYLLELLFNC